MYEVTIKIWLYVFVMDVHVNAGDTVSKYYYTEDGKLCFKCGPGTFLTNHCEDSNTLAVCSPCPDGSYQSNYTIARYCSPCTTCDHVVKNYKVAKVLENCTSIADTVCGCLDGWYFQKIPGSEREGICRNASTCEPGFEVEIKVTNYSDTICRPCPSGFYKDSFSLKSCTPCTNECSVESDMVSQCNSTHDTMCTKRKVKSSDTKADLEMETILGIAIASVLFFIICVVVAVLFCVRRKRTQEKDGSKDGLTFHGPRDQSDCRLEQLNWNLLFRGISGKDSNWTKVFQECSTNAVIIHNWEHFIRYLFLECEKGERANGIIVEVSRAYEQTMVRERIYNALDRWQKSCFDGDDDSMFQKFMSAFRKVEKYPSV